MTRRGAPWLMDRMTGEMSPIPATCPQCGSTQLTTIGAGTERVESIIRERFPAANIVRADADTLDHPGIFSSILRSFDEGKIDILLGTQPVLAGLRSPHVTLAAVLVADQGLSIPDFRAGERVFQSVSTVIRSMRGRGTAIIQTFRPDAPEIRHAVRGDTLGYLEEEWGVRTRTGYPPVSQLIDLIVRRDEGRARLLKERAEQIGKTLGIAVSEYHGHDVTRFTWVIRLRGKRVREALNMLPLTGVTIDVDPVA